MFHSVSRSFNPLVVLLLVSLSVVAHAEKRLQLQHQVVEKTPNFMGSELTALRWSGMQLSGPWGVVVHHYRGQAKTFKLLVHFHHKPREFKNKCSYLNYCNVYRVGLTPRFHFGCRSKELRLKNNSVITISVNPRHVLTCVIAPKPWS